MLELVMGSIQFGLVQFFMTRSDLIFGRSGLDLPVIEALSSVYSSLPMRERPPASISEHQCHISSKRASLLIRSDWSEPLGQGLAGKILALETTLKFQEKRITFFRFAGIFLEADASVRPSYSILCLAGGK